MITVEPIGSEATRRLAELASRPDVVRFGDHTPDTPAGAWRRWIGSPDPHAGLTLGAWRRRSLVAAARLSLTPMRRRMHGATLELLASAEEHADAALDALLRAALDACDRWLQV